jgi:hypothetical protein
LPLGKLQFRRRRRSTEEYLSPLAAGMLVVRDNVTGKIGSVTAPLTVN